MTAKFASHTKVPVDRSQAELGKLLRKYGATQYVVGWDEELGDRIAFTYNGRNVVLELPLPPERDWKYTTSGNMRAFGEAASKHGQCVRQRWRGLVLVIKAKLEAVELGIVTFEDEFLAHTQLPNGKTVSAVLTPQINMMVADGKMPKLLGTGR